MPVFSTSNLSVLRSARSSTEGELCGLYRSPHRHPDAEGQAVASSRTCTGSRTPRHLANTLFDLATHNFGYPIRVFLASPDCGARDEIALVSLSPGRGGMSPSTRPRRAGINVARSATSCACADISRPSLPSAVWRSASRSCRSPRPSCSPPFCPAIAITSPSSTMKLRADQSWTIDAAGAQEVVDRGSAQQADCWRRRPRHDPLRPSAALHQSQQQARLHRPPDARPQQTSLQVLKLRAMRSKGARVLGYVGEHTGEILDPRRSCSRKSPGAPARRWP